MPVPVHARTQIRAAVVAAITGLATTGTRVYSGRSRPLGAATGATLLVYAQRTDAVPDSRPPRKMVHTLDLVIEGRVSAGEAADLEAQLDQIELEVQTALAADTTLGGKVKDIILTRSTLSAQAPGERHEGEVRLEYQIEFRTAETAPGVIID